MASQLTAEHPPAPGFARDLDVPPDDGSLLRHAVSASAALRRADGVQQILDVLTWAALLAAPAATVWAVQRAGGAVARAGAHDTTSPPRVTSGAFAFDPAALLDELHDHLQESQSPFEVESGVAARLTAFPLTTADALGALFVAAPDGLTSEQRSVLALLADEAAGALSLRSARSAAEHAEALIEALTRLSASFSEREHVLKLIARSAADLMRTNAAWIMLADEEKKRLTITTAHGITSTSFFEATCGTDELLPGAAIRRRRVLCVGDVRGDEHAKYTNREGLRSIFCAPMFVEDELLGVLIAADRETRDLEPDERRLMDALASAAAIAIANARLYTDHEVSIERLAGLNALLEDRSAFQQRLTDLVLAGADLDALVTAATEGLGAPVLLLDRDLVALGAGPPGGVAIDTPALRKAILESDDIATGTGTFTLALDEETRVRVAPLDLGGERTAYVVVDAGDAAVGDLGMTEAAVTAIGLELMRERATAEAEARLTGGLFQTLLADDGSDDAAVLRRASYLGYELAGENVVIAATVHDDQKGSRPQLGLQSVIHRAVRRHWDAPTPVFERDDAVFVLVSDPDEVSPALIKEQCRLVRQAIELSGLTTGAHVAYAGPHRGVAGVRQAVGEAAYALQVQEVIGKSTAPVAFDELGVWTLLGRVGSREHLASFAQSVLGELLAHDADRRAQLVDTLRTLIQCNFHYRTAAELLFAHPNTIRYRMSRIGTLTGLDLTNGDDRLKVELALRILDVVGTGRVAASG